MRGFECHVSVLKPASPAGMDDLHKIARRLLWKTSVIDGDPDMGDTIFFYFTRHRALVAPLMEEMEELSDALRAAGYPVVRQKIEQIIYDRRYPK